MVDIPVYLLTLIILIELSKIVLITSPGRALFFGRFMLNQFGRTACSSEAGGCAGSHVATGRVSQDRQLSAEQPDKCPTMRR
jgi:hypothetical protein